MDGMSAPSVHVEDASAAATPASTDAAAAARVLMLAERTRWAMRIHDGLTQSVTSAVLELETLRRRIESDPPAAARAIADVEAEIRRDLDEIRAILFELDEPDAPQRPALTIARFVADVLERWKLPARVSVDEDVDRVPAAVQEVAHAILAEALANAAKHAGSGEVVLSVRATPHDLRVEVEDRGLGTPAVEAGEERHFGLRQMRARVAAIGGTLEITSNPGSGTRVVAILPVGEEER
jgi:signal transduction histidine kinase